MLPENMKGASCAALLLAVAFQGFAQSYGLLLSVGAVVGAAVVLQQAAHEQQYLWAAAFDARGVAGDRQVTEEGINDRER